MSGDLHESIGHGCSTAHWLHIERVVVKATFLLDSTSSKLGKVSTCGCLSTQFYSIMLILSCVYLCVYIYIY